MRILLGDLVKELEQMRLEYGDDSIVKEHDGNLVILGDKGDYQETIVLKGE